MESNRARSQGTALSLIVLHVDRGGDLLRQHGDAAVDHFIEQLARAVSSAVRQTDVAVKYTAWSLVFILPDTNFENAKALAEKLRNVAATVQPFLGRPRPHRQRRRRPIHLSPRRRNRRPRHRMDESRRSRHRRSPPARRQHPNRTRHSVIDRPRPRRRFTPPVPFRNAGVPPALLTSKSPFSSTGIPACANAKTHLDR